MKYVGLFFIVFFSASSAFSATLMLRAHVPAVYTIQWIEARATLTSNVVDTRSRLVARLTQERKNGETIITIVHP